MKKKVSVKKPVKKTAVKKPAVKKPAAKKAAMVEVVQPLRSFWGLFDKVKNHNFQLMVQKTNSLRFFIQVVEFMPEDQFQHIFTEKPNRTVVWKEEAIDCGCPYNAQCLCIKSKRTFGTSVFTEYLKKNNLDAYEIEIEHLRYLIRLQAEGTAVSESHSLNEFAKRSGTIDQLKEKQDIETKNKAKQLIEAKTKALTELLDKEQAEAKRKKDREAKYQAVVDAIKKSSDDELDPIKRKEKEIFEKTDKQSCQLKDMIVNPTSYLTASRSSLLSDLAKTQTQKQINHIFEKQKEQIAESVSAITSLGSALNNTESNPANFDGSLKGALQTITKYARIISNDYEDAPMNAVSATMATAALPDFWKELNAARDVCEKFDEFYARKHVAFMKATRKMNQESVKFLNVPEDHDYLTCLHKDTKEYLKSQREFEVAKKILQSANKAFSDIEVKQADPEYLKTEMARYSAIPQTNQYVGLLDHLGPNKIAYDLAMANRAKNLASITKYKTPPPAPLGEVRLESAKQDTVQQLKVVDSQPDISTKEGRAAYREKLAEKQLSQSYFHGFKAEEPNVNVHANVGGYTATNNVDTFFSRFKPSQSVIEKTAAEIKKMVASGLINPEKDFDDLIREGLSPEAVEFYKKERIKDSQVEPIVLTDEEKHAIRCTVSKFNTESKLSKF